MPGQPWQDAAGRYDVAAAWQRLGRQGIGVTWPGQADFPSALIADPLPPAVLFWRGDLGGLDRPCVALVGTRRATAGGRGIAYELGRDLAAAGVCVVSGLALGIDGAAHRGALAAGGRGCTVGVAASGVDRVYPRQHDELWTQVAAEGAVISETPPGRAAQAWRFPARNRIIAGLAAMVVVVESHSAGGSLITADAAIERGVEVRAVPGPVRSPASAGTNQLLYDGPGPVRDAVDILDGLGIFVSRPLEAPRARPPSGGAAPRRSEPAPIPTTGPSAAVDLDGDQRTVLDAVGWRPTSFNAVVAASRLGVGRTAAALEALALLHVVSSERDWWQRQR
jgi:DNA processing protein